MVKIKRENGMYIVRQGFLTVTVAALGKAFKLASRLAYAPATIKIERERVPLTVR